ncbi:MAG: hypothetical protein ACTS2F_06205 [Thainema sp.]
MPPKVKDRFLAYATAWIIALMITAPFAVQLFPFFPLGLFLVFSQPTDLPLTGLAVAGWFTYAIHAAFLFLTSSRTFYFVAYAVLIVMLLTNVVGCRKLLNELSSIH